MTHPNDNQNDNRDRQNSDPDGKFATFFDFLARLIALCLIGVFFLTLAYIILAIIGAIFSGHAGVDMNI